MKRCLPIALAASLILWGALWANGAELAWSTFLGGSSGDHIQGIAVDDSGCAHVIGWTQSADFPVTTGAFDTAFGGNNDVFVAKLTRAGDVLLYATLLGGSSYEWGSGIAIDALGNAYLSGTTTSTDFPVTPGSFGSTFSGGCDDAFVVRLNANGDSLNYATYLGGGYGDYGRTVTVDQSGYAFVTGWTMSVDFPVTSGALDTTYNGGDYDAFVTKIDPSGSALVWSTFLGGNDRDCGYGIALDGFGNACLTGSTRSADFPTTVGAFDISFNGGTDDAFMAKIDSLGDALAYSTFLGGCGSDAGQSLVVHPAAEIYLTGRTGSSDFPVTNAAFDTSFNGGGCDLFAVHLNTAGGAPNFATLLGGNDLDEAVAVAVDNSGNVFLIGQTESADFLTTAGAFDTLLTGASESFVVELAANGDTLNYSTFLGGSAREEGGGISVDGSGGVYICGSTMSYDFPVTNEAFDVSFNGGYSDAFIAKFKIATEDPYPPEQVANLQVTLCTDDLLLDWSPVTVDTNGNPLQVDFYCVYRDTSVFFNPDANLFTSTEETFFMDTSAVVGSGETSYYYAVTATSKGMESNLSGLVGGFRRQLITLPKSP